MSEEHRYGNLPWRLRGVARLMDAAYCIPEDGEGNTTYEPRIVYERDRVEFSMRRKSDNLVEFACSCAGSLSEANAEKILDLAARHCLYSEDFTDWMIGRKPQE